MQIIRNQRVEEDTWQHVSDGEPLVEGPVTVSLKRWLEERDTLSARGDIGVRLAPADELDELLADLAQISLLVLEFPAITEGRGYTQARLLRTRHGYSGEIRATGDVQHDQLSFMQRCGIDSFVVREDRDIDDALQAFGEVSVRYQPAADDETLIFHRREQG